MDTERPDDRGQMTDDGNYNSLLKKSGIRFLETGVRRGGRGLPRRVGFELGYPGYRDVGVRFLNLAFCGVFLAVFGLLFFHGHAGRQF